jgi:hypothetical protein
MGVSGHRHTPAALQPQAKDPRYPLYRRLGGPQSRSGHKRLEEKSFRLCRGANLDRMVVQPAARHYADRATRLTNRKGKGKITSAFLGFRCMKFLLQSVNTWPFISGKGSLLIPINQRLETAFFFQDSLCGICIECSRATNVLLRAFRFAPQGHYSTRITFTHTHSTFREEYKASKRIVTPSVFSWGCSCDCELRSTQGSRFLWGLVTYVETQNLTSPALLWGNISSLPHITFCISQ